MKEAMFTFPEPAIWGGQTWVVFFREGYSQDGFLDEPETTDTSDVTDERGITFHLLAQTETSINFTLTRQLDSGGWLRFTYTVTPTETTTRFETSGLGGDEFEPISQFVWDVWLNRFHSNIPFFMQRKGEVTDEH
jgi:hypothetical protein